MTDHLSFLLEPNTLKNLSAKDLTFTYEHALQRLQQMNAKE